MGEVINLHGSKPSLTVKCDEGHSHYVPLNVVVDIAFGRVCLTTVEDCIVRALIMEYLRLLQTHISNDGDKSE